MQNNWILRHYRIIENKNESKNEIYIKTMFHTIVYKQIFLIGKTYLF